MYTPPHGGVHGGGYPPVGSWGFRGNRAPEGGLGDSIRRWGFGGKTLEGKIVL
jgi:hypothetical protein